MLKFLALAALAVGAFAEEASTLAPAAPIMCGEAAADSTRTCISVRLPWQEDPIYFCTDKVKISYKERCGLNTNRYCYGQDREHTLQIATPWDCCPITSIPDFCAGRSCPVAPFNRTCEEILPDKKDPWDCCSKFYCDKDVKAEECHMTRLTPGCMKAPKSKASCIGFKDRHGCCNKYQCEGEGKSGMCPAEAKALKFKQLMEEATKSNSTRMSRIGHGMHKNKHHMFRHMFGGMGSSTFMRCTGDYTCPGTMKCCSMNVESYHGVRNLLSKSSQSTEQAVYGFCMDAVETDAEVKLAIEDMEFSTVSPPEGSTEEDYGTTEAADM